MKIPRVFKLVGFSYWQSWGYGCPLVVVIVKSCYKALIQFQNQNSWQHTILLRLVLFRISRFLKKYYKTLSTEPAARWADPNLYFMETFLIAWQSIPQLDSEGKHRYVWIAASQKVLHLIGVYWNFCYTKYGRWAERNNVRNISVQGLLYVIFKKL